MKKIIYRLLILVTCYTPLQAQNQWTLKECINYAIDNNIEVKQKELKTISADIDLNTSKNERLPNLNAVIGESFNFDRSQLGPGAYKSLNSNTTTFGLETETPIFTGFRIKNDINAKKFSMMSSIADLETTKNNLELNITALYLEVLFKKEILKVYQEQLLSTNQQVEKTQVLVSAGKVPRSQEYDILAQQAKDELNITMAQNDLNLSLLNLSQALNLTDDVEFDIASDYDKEEIDPNKLLLPPDEIYNIALDLKPNVKVAEYDLESKKSNLGVAKSAYYPTLSLKAGYSTSYNNKRSDNFGEQFRNMGNEYISLNLNIPIFNRFQVRNKVRTAKLDIEVGKLNVLNTKRALYKEIQQAHQQATAAQSKFKATEKALSASQESYDYALMRYDVGNFTVFELNDAQMKLTSSKSDMIQAKYDFIFRNKILDFYSANFFY